MHYLPLTILAYLLNGTSVLIDKFLLTKTINNPLVYIFYISLFSLTSLVVVPFVPFPSEHALLLASLSTLLWTTGAYFMYRGLRYGQASGVIPVIGTLVPTFLMIYGLFTNTITSPQLTAISFLIGGLFFLTFTNWRKHNQTIVLLAEVFSALFFAISYIVLRQAYLQAPFLTILGWSRVALIPLLAVAVLLPWTHKIIFGSRAHDVRQHPRSGLLFLVGQMTGGASELLLTFCISLATPALVNSINGVSYIFTFIASLFLAKKFPTIFTEKTDRWSLLSKTIGIVLVSVGIYLLASTEM